MNTVRCPICGKQAKLRRLDDWPRFPFCSDRCRTIDLGRWLGERYAVPDRSVDPDDPELGDTADGPNEVP